MFELVCENHVQIKAQKNLFLSLISNKNSSWITIWFAPTDEYGNFTSKEDMANKHRLKFVDQGSQNFLKIQVSWILLGPYKMHIVIFPKSVVNCAIAQNMLICGYGGSPLSALRWLYCLTIIGYNFVLNDLLHQTLISYNGPWFIFSFMHIWWHHDNVIKF